MAGMAWLGRLRSTTVTWHRLYSIARVEFGETRTEQSVLGRGQDPVSHELIERHPSAQRPETRHHPAAEYRFRFAVAQRGHQPGQFLGSVLAISMEHGDE